MKKTRVSRKKHVAALEGPARVIIKRAPHQSVGAVHREGITAYPAVWEAFRERKLIYLLLMCDDITSVKAQPPEISYRTDDGERKYFPDLGIETRDRGEVLVEVKALRYLIQSEALAKYTTIAAHLRSQHRALDFITEDQIPPLWFDNAYLLHRYSTHDVPMVRRQIKTRLSAMPAMAVAELQAALGKETTLNDVYGLIAQRVLAIDWDTPLSRRASVSLPDKPFRRMTYERIRRQGRYVDLLAEMALGRRPSDQQVLAASFARRRPLAPACVYGFVDGFTPAQLGHLKRAMSRRAAHASDGEAEALGATVGTANELGMED